MIDQTDAHGGSYPESPPSDPGSGQLVRPYALTRGRTRAQMDIALEALVSATGSIPSPALPGGGGEARAIMQACTFEMQSLAEISARLSLPLGVARVLVGDLAMAGALAVHAPGSVDGGETDLLERVLRGLHRL
ncbi:MAG: DUF742 domain-containing protein [Dermatophilaceae bacterium]